MPSTSAGVGPPSPQVVPWFGEISTRFEAGPSERDGDDVTRSAHVNRKREQQATAPRGHGWWVGQEVTDSGYGSSSFLVGRDFADFSHWLCLGAEQSDAPNGDKMLPVVARAIPPDPSPSGGGGAVVVAR